MSVRLPVAQTISNAVVWYITTFNMQILQQKYEPYAVQTSCSYEIHKCICHMAKKKDKLSP
jgi:hypothetical protein